MNVQRWQLYTQLVTGNAPLVSIGEYDTKAKMIAVKDSLFLNGKSIDKTKPIKTVVYKNGLFYSSP